MTDLTPAFPIVDETGEVHEGMDLRDYFAAKAMQAYIASEPNIASTSYMIPLEGKMVGCAGPDSRWDDEAVALAAYSIADAMVAMRLNASVRAQADA